jgi:hypothetical protein
MSIAIRHRAQGLGGDKEMEQSIKLHGEHPPKRSPEEQIRLYGKLLPTKQVKGDENECSFIPPTRLVR